LLVESTKPTSLHVPCASAHIRAAQGSIQRGAKRRRRVNKNKLSYRKRTARRTMSVKILSIGAQLYENWDVVANLPGWADAHRHKCALRWFLRVIR